TIIGSTSVQPPSLTLVAGLPPARIVEVRVINALLGQPRDVVATVSGATTLIARPRLNDEPADVLDASIAGATTFNPNL
ncbi:hypothetical protein ABTJ80_21335, partial [Acinetobacter baumannii]